MTIILQAARLLGPRQIGRRASVTTDTMKILLWELSDGAVLELHREVVPGKRPRFTLVRERGDGFEELLVYYERGRARPGLQPQPLRSSVDVPPLVASAASGGFAGVGPAASL